MVLLERMAQMDQMGSVCRQGGGEGQVLSKKTSTDFDTEWVDLVSGISFYYYWNSNGRHRPNDYRCGMLWSDSNS